MRFKSLKVGDRPIPQRRIEQTLTDLGLGWLLDCEVEDADVQVVNKTVIWNSGTLYTGTWHYGVWKSGDFHGRWENGIFESGRMLGDFLSGVIDDSLLA
jgi:hypothetical protein